MLGYTTGTAFVPRSRSGVPSQQQDASAFSTSPSYSTPAPPPLETPILNARSRGRFITPRSEIQDDSSMSSDDRDSSPQRTPAAGKKQKRAPYHQFTREEDLLLLEVVSEVGNGNWQKVLALLHQSHHDFTWVQVRFVCTCIHLCMHIGLQGSEAPL